MGYGLDPESDRYFTRLDQAVQLPSPRPVESWIVDPGPQIGFHATSPAASKFEVARVQEPGPQGCRSLLLKLPEQDSGAYFGSRLPDIGSQGRIELGEFRLQSGLADRRIHILTPSQC
jgi:hypothetical protein